MVYIYLITNLVNGKQYVGQTERSVEQRFNEHSNAESPLGEAIQIYGAKNFRVEILERCFDNILANIMEKIYIEFYDCAVPNGYNRLRYYYIYDELCSAKCAGEISYQKFQECLSKLEEISLNRAQKRAQAKQEKIIELKRLHEQYSENPNLETAKQLKKAILDACSVDIDRKTGKVRKVHSSQENADLIFTYDPDIDGLFGYDEFQQADVFLKPAPWDKNIKRGDLWTDRDDAELRIYLLDNYTEFTGKKLIRDKLIQFSRARSFNSKLEDKKPIEIPFFDW